MTTVLTIDDSKVVRTMVTRHLQPYGCTVVEAQNGLEGLETARQHRPDLILLDVTMPVMDGRQCLAELRKDDACKKIPVIMLTAESGRDIVVELAKLGVTGYIVKPFQQETFEKEVNKVLGGTAGAASASASAATTIDATAVLVVDDSQKILDLARGALESSMKVLTALGGSAAVDQYKQALPGVVVIDLVMPDMDGFATLQELQKLGKSTFVALTLRGDAAAQEQAKKAGYHAIVEKPFQGSELLDKLKTLMPGAGGELFRELMSEHDGCPVFRLPDQASGPKVVPQLLKQLRVLADDGNDKLILDLAACNDIGGDQMTTLARLLAEAETLGIRTAICAPNAQVVAKLQQIAETKNAPHATTRDLARSSLQ